MKTTHVCNSKWRKYCAQMVLHIIEVRVKWLQSQCPSLNPYFFMFTVVLWNAQVEIGGRAVGMWLYLLPHFLWINGVSVFLWWKQTWTLTIMNWGHYFITVCWEQIRQIANWGNCLKFWCEKCIKRVKICWFMNFLCFLGWKSFWGQNRWENFLHMILCKIFPV